MVPVAGSAYTYAYATLGELFAWIIGWDLVLEYAVGIGHGRQRLVQLLPDRCLPKIGVRLPAALRKAPIALRRGRPAHFVSTGRHRQPARRDRGRHRDDDPGEGHPGERRLQRDHGRHQAGRRCCS